MAYPTRCYTFLKTENTIAMIRYGETGYYPVNVDLSLEEFESLKILSEKQLVNALNFVLDISDAEIHAMEICSMTGNWEKFDYIVDIIEGREANE